MKALELLALLVLQFGTLSTRFTRRHTATCFLRARPISAASISKPCDRLDSAQHCRCESGIHYFDTTSQREEILHLNGEHMSLHTQYTELMPLAGFAHLSCICLASAVESENAEFYAELGHDVNCLNNATPERLYCCNVHRRHICNTNNIYHTRLETHPTQCLSWIVQR